jgi:hypothetical protein
MPTDCLPRIPIRCRARARRTVRSPFVSRGKPSSMFEEEYEERDERERGEGEGTEL